MMNDYQNYEEMGGYPITTSDTQGASDTGGSFSSGGGGGGRTRNKRSSITRLTVKQALECEHIDGGMTALRGTHTPLGNVIILGKVLHVDVKTSHVDFLVDDGTGAMEVKYWRQSQESAASGDENGDFSSQNGSYCKFIGYVQLWEGKVQLYAFQVTQIEDANEITAHMLDAIYTTLGSKFGPLEVPENPNQQQQQQGQGYMQHQHQQQQQYHADNTYSDHNLAESISYVVSSSTNAQDRRGVHINTIIDSLRGRWNEQAIRTVVAEMEGMGALYVTGHPECYKIP